MNYYDPRYMTLQEEKLKSIIHKEKSVIVIARELGVSRQTIHKWLQRYKRFGVDGLFMQRKKRHAIAHNRTSPEVEQLVINIAKDCFNDGVLTLSDRIQSEYNLSLNLSTLYRILKRNDVRYTETMEKETFCTYHTRI